ncbi:cation transporter, partial [Klebsiella pneumoniae]|nr:cation transporter [Klebsiella pneumoniae]
LEGAPEDASPDKVEQRLISSVKGLAAVSHIHVWQITSGRTMATLEVRAKEDVDVKDVVKLVKQELYEQFKIEHATVGIDWNCDQNDNTCSLS